MKDTVIFHLAKHFPPRSREELAYYPEPTLYEKFRNGDKTSEFRGLGKKGFWLKTLCKPLSLNMNDDRQRDLTPFLRVHKAWLVECYPKHSLPRLEADIIGLLYEPECQFPLEIKLKVQREVMTLAQKHVAEANRELGRILATHRAQATSLLFVVPKETTG